MTERTYCDEHSDHGMQDITSRTLSKTITAGVMVMYGRCKGGNKGGHGPHAVSIVVPEGTGKYQVVMACGHTGIRVMAS